MKYSMSQFVLRLQEIVPQTVTSVSLDDQVMTTEMILLRPIPACFKPETTNKNEFCSHTIQKVYVK